MGNDSSVHYGISHDVFPQAGFWPCSSFFPHLHGQLKINNGEKKTSFSSVQIWINRRLKNNQRGELLLRTHQRFWGPHQPPASKESAAAIKLGQKTHNKQQPSGARRVCLWRTLRNMLSTFSRCNIVFDVSFTATNAFVVPLQPVNSALLISRLLVWRLNAHTVWTVCQNWNIKLVMAGAQEDTEELLYGDHNRDKWKKKMLCYL